MVYTEILTIENDVGIVEVHHGKARPYLTTVLVQTCKGLMLF